MTERKVETARHLGGIRAQKIRVKGRIEPGFQSHPHPGQIRRDDTQSNRRIGRQRGLGPGNGSGTLGLGIRPGENLHGPTVDRRGQPDFITAHRHPSRPQRSTEALLKRRQPVEPGQMDAGRQGKLPGLDQAEQTLMQARQIDPAVSCTALQEGGLPGQEAPRFIRQELARRQHAPNPAQRMRLRRRCRHAAQIEQGRGVAEIGGDHLLPEESLRHRVERLRQIIDAAQQGIVRQRGQPLRRGHGLRRAPHGLLAGARPAQGLGKATGRAERQRSRFERHQGVPTNKKRLLAPLDE